MQLTTKKYQRTAFLMENIGLGTTMKPIKTRQQAPNGVIYAKSHVTKLRLFITFQLSQKWSGFDFFFRFQFIYFKLYLEDNSFTML